MGLGRYSGLLARVTLTAVATGALTAGSPPQDQAGKDEEYVTMTPNPAQPGSQVTITTNACAKSANVTAVSRAFPGYSVPLSLRNGRMLGTTTLPSGVYPSQYAVAVRCANEDATGYFKVVQRASRHPTSGPDTGGGGLAMGAESARQAGASSSRAPWLAGALAVLMAVAGTAAALVRRRRRPGRDGAP
ncbi:hypothetical protein [Nonomuraea dietziae]|uniref:hypothetical protein n=1 Tax=Nonomuraea dietziae TaxID=65515 RepID=UPI0033D576AF